MNKQQWAKIENVCGLCETTGSPDVIIIGKFRDAGELSKFARYLLVLPSVSRTDTYVVLTTVKEEIRILP